MYPVNKPELIQNLIKRLKLQKEWQQGILVRIKMDPDGYLMRSPYPKVVSIRELFERYLDIQTPPSRYFFSVASHFSTNPQHVEKLRILSSSTNQGFTEYYEYCERERRNMFEVLYDFDSVNIPFEYLLEIF